MNARPRRQGNRWTHVLGLLGRIDVRMARPLGTHQLPDDRSPVLEQPLSVGRLTRGRARALSLGLAAVGLIGVVVSGSILIGTGHAWWTWVQSEEHRQVEHRLDAIFSRSGASTVAAARAGPTEGQVAPRGGLPADDAGQNVASDGPMPRRGPRRSSMCVRARPGRFRHRTSRACRSWGPSFASLIRPGRGPTHGSPSRCGAVPTCRISR